MLRVVMILATMMFASMSTLAQDESAGASKSREIPLSEVPAAAMAGADKVQQGVYFTSAETVWWRDELVYRLKGSRFKEEWAVYVNVQGTVVHVSNDIRDR